MDARLVRVPKVPQVSVEKTKNGSGQRGEFQTTPPKTGRREGGHP